MRNIAKSYITMSRLITGLATIILIIGGVFFYHSADTYNLKEQHNRIEAINLEEKEIGENSSYLISEILKPDLELIASSHSQILKIDFTKASKIKEFLVDRAAGFTYADVFYFGREADGKIISAKQLFVAKGYDPRKRLWYRLAVGNNKINLTKPYIDANTNKLCITFSNSIYENGRLVGVLGVDVFVDSIIKLLKGIESSQNAHLYIIDNDGLINFSKDTSKIGLNIKQIFNISLNDISGKKILASEVQKKEYGEYVNIGKGKVDNHKIYVTTVPGYDWKIITYIDPSTVNTLNQGKYSSMTSFIPILIFTLLILIVIIIQNNLNKRQLVHNLNHDMLTKLPNRFNFEGALRRIAHKCNQGSKAVLILMDVDNFKFYNDTIGNINADKIIIGLAEFIKLNTDKKSYIYRVGGDEFAVVIKNITYEKAKEISENYRRLIDETPICVENNYYDLTISIGSTLFDNTLSFEKILSYADTALLLAKDEGKNRVNFSFSELDISSVGILELDEINKTIGLIKNAIKENRFLLYFQPIMRLDSRKISHYEALVRLKAENGDIYLPSAFIPVAEKFGLITAIDRWVFNSTLELLETYKDITIFMNLSGISIADDTLLKYFEKSIMESGIKSEQLNLGIEITETAATKNFNQAERWIKKFKELGCRISIDDFGVGYTSFSYLNSLPVDFVKIDGSFIKDIDTNSDHRAIVEAIHRLVKTLGKESIAEYVESIEIMEILSELGIQYGQGYYIGKPLPKQESLDLSR